MQRTTTLHHAEDIVIRDAGGYITSTDVEGALQEVAVQTYAFLLQAHGNSGTIGAGVTNYMAAGIAGLSATAVAAFISKAGTLKNLYIRTSSAQPATGTLVVTVTVNGVDSAIVATVTAGGGAGTYSDLSNTASISAGDRIGLKLVNNASGASAGVGATSVDVEISTT